MYSYGPLHRDEQRQDVQLEHTYSSSVQMVEVARKTSQKQWTIGSGGERKSDVSVLIVWHDDDDDDDNLSWLKESLPLGWPHNMWKKN